MDSVLFRATQSLAVFLESLKGLRGSGATSWRAGKASLKKKYKMGSSLFPGIASFPGKDTFPGGKNGE